MAFIRSSRTRSSSIEAVESATKSLLFRAYQTLRETLKEFV